MASPSRAVLCEWSRNAKPTSYSATISATGAQMQQELHATPPPASNVIPRSLQVPTRVLDYSTAAPGPLDCRTMVLG